MTARMLIKVIFLLIVCLHSSAAAQGFAGLGRTAEGFSVAQRGYDFAFPADHGAHTDFQIEWWYVTANLKDETGLDLGLQWTLFRSALAPEEGQGWQSPQVWLGHAAVTTPEDHFATERYARGGIGQAGVTADPFEAWIDEWVMQGETFEQLRMRAAGPEFAFDVALNARGPLVFHGDAGYSQKSQSGRASYYYSQPFFEVVGTLQLPEGVVTVTGTAWLDREWASQPLAASQVSWDWFSMVFDDGTRLMGFNLHDSDGGDYTSATWITAQGQATSFPHGAFSATPLEHAVVAGRDVPVRWRVRLPQKGVDVVVEAINNDAWMDLTIAYWEGPVRISGTHEGRGYLEMTGY